MKKANKHLLEVDLLGFDCFRKIKRMFSFGVCVHLWKKSISYKLVFLPEW